MAETKLMAVVGRPVYHSRSPHIFNSLFQELGIDAVYMRLSAENGKETIETAKAMKLAGINVTTPLKNDVMPFLDCIDHHAAAIEAVNCVTAQNGKYKGWNTDFIGAVNALMKNGINPANKEVVILGAGGAARAAAYGFARADVKKVTLMNRTPDTAKRASRRLGCDHAPLEMAEKLLGQSDIFISCISSPSDVINPDHLKKGLVVMDANYRDSNLARVAAGKGCIVIEGFEWLLHQAFHSFRNFTGKEIPLGLQAKTKINISNSGVPGKANLALVGFMGSGKTTIGKLLAKKMRREFVDTDQLIVRILGMTIPQIFRKKGETFFRVAEKSILKKLIPASKNKVFSLGGGATFDEGNRQLINQHCCSIWLWSSASTALKRIDLASRPLLNGLDAEGKAEAMLKSRIPFYARASDLVVSSESGNEEEIARGIRDEMD